MRVANYYDNYCDTAHALLPPHVICYGINYHEKIDDATKWRAPRVEMKKGHNMYTLIFR